MRSWALRLLTKTAVAFIQGNVRAMYFFRGDYLYWKPHVSGLELDFGTGALSEDLIDGKQLIKSREYDADPHGNWDTGYRLAGGDSLPSSSLEIDLFWNSFEGSGRKNSRKSNRSQNEGNYRVSFEQIDAVLAYKTSLTTDLALKPFLGVRGAKIHQSVHALVVTDLFLSPNTLAKETSLFNDKQNYYGIGPLLGLEAEWNLRYGFALYGTAAAGLLYGDYRLRFKDADIFTSPLSKEILSKNKRELYNFDCNVDLALGFLWHASLCESVRVVIKLGFEHHEYFNQNRLGANRGDLSFDGVIFSTSFTF